MKQILSQVLLKHLEAYTLELLAQGRPNWDVPHTRAVVHYASEIACAEQQDFLVLVTAAWLHDVGYAGLFPEGHAEQSTIRLRKSLHMERGMGLAQAWLDRPEVSIYYQPEQRQRILHLVGIHDQIERLTDLDEIIIMEADTLGAIDLSRIMPTFDRSTARRYIEGVRQKRMPRFVTVLGQQYLNILLPFYERHFSV